MNDSLNADPKLIDQNHSSSFGGWTRPKNLYFLSYKYQKKKKKNQEPDTKKKKKKQKQMKKHN